MRDARRGGGEEDSEKEGGWHTFTVNCTVTLHGHEARTCTALERRRAGQGGTASVVAPDQGQTGASRPMFRSLLSVVSSRL